MMKLQHWADIFFGFIGSRRRLKLVVVLVAGAFWGSCMTSSGDGYRADIRRTSHGIPHITASDFGSLGFGEGYAFAEDHLCSLADQIIKVRGERARYFGPGEDDEHLKSDVGYRALGIADRAREIYQSTTGDMREWIDGYVAGYNAYLRETSVDSVAGWCRGQNWVFEISPADLIAYHQAVTISGTIFTAAIATAEPPAAEKTKVAGVEIPEMDRASNGWAIGSERSEGGRGMLVANPHYPWVGSNRFWEKHLTIPGRLDVYGVGLLGIPGVAIGFNEAVAWTHTVSDGIRSTLYTLNLVTGQPTRYLYDGEEREMTSRTISIAVRKEDGSLDNVSREVFFSHYGPIINVNGYEWTHERALTFRDANAENTLSRFQWLAMNMARSLEEFKQAHAEHNAMPWVNTIAASKDGRAWYIDGSATPNLSDEAIAEWVRNREQNPDVGRAWQRKWVLLDGSDSRFEWVEVPGTRSGVVPHARIPQLERRDFVFNANDSYWLANPRQLLTGFSPLHGLAQTARSLRTRMNVVILDDTSPGGPAGEDGKFSLEELAGAAFSNRSMAAELLREELVARCKSARSVTVDGQNVDLQKACDILEKWNGRYDLGSVGPVLWREFLARYDARDLGRAGALFREGFDPADPVGTPRGLAAPSGGKDPVLENLGRAIQLLAKAGVALDAPLGQLQYSDKNGGRIPIHGGDGTFEGITNFVRYGGNGTTLEPGPRPQRVQGSRFLTTQGYPINSGTSFIMALEFTDTHPRALALLTYSQSGDPTSPLFYDQTELFSAKKWRPILFTEDQIKADPALNVKTVTGGQD